MRHTRRAGGHPRSPHWEAPEINVRLGPCLPGAHGPVEKTEQAVPGSRVPGREAQASPESARKGEAFPEEAAPAWSL